MGRVIVMKSCLIVILYFIYTSVYGKRTHFYTGSTTSEPPSPLRKPPSPVQNRVSST